VQSQVLALASALRELDVDAGVFAPGNEPAAKAGVTIVGRSVGIRANGSVAPISPWPSTWKRTVREIRDGSFDVVHVHEPFVPGPALAAVLGSAVPIVGTFHQSGWKWPYQLTLPLVRLLGRRLAITVAVSESAAAMVRRPLGRDVEVLWNGVDIPEDVVPRRPGDGPSTIVFVGRHETRKGLEVLLRAMAHLGRDVRLSVIGEGPLTEELQSSYRDDRIEWLGRVGESERVARLRQADVFCAPNLGGESFGLVLAEAMACAAPVVASDLDAFRAVARPERDEAILVPPGDPTALAEGLGRALADSSLRQTLSEAGRRRAEELSIGRLASRYVELYQGAARAPG
jgi:phosphatidylinositol alpha-mannosyltransferase